MRKMILHTCILACTYSLQLSVFVALGGMESTSMDLSQLDEGTGRSVPSTPLRTTAPVTISEAAIASALNPQKTTASSAGEMIELTPAQAEAERVEGHEEGVLEEG